jgi:hypothetical protein
MTIVSKVRQLSDGEELILAVEHQASTDEGDPRDSSFERRSRALSDARHPGNSPRVWSPSLNPRQQPLTTAR